MAGLPRSIPVPALLAFAFLLAGCAAPDGPDATMPDGPDAAMARSGLALDDCEYLLGFVPMDWAAAQDLLPAGFVPLTWTVDEDPVRAFAVLQVLFADCRAATVDGVAVGASASLWLQPDVASDQAPLLEQNNFHAYGAHSNPQVQAFWARLGRSEPGTFEVVADEPERAAVVTATAPGLVASITFRETGTVAAPVTDTWRVFHADAAGAAHVDMGIEGARATFPGELDLAAAQVPFPILPRLPSAVTSGFGTGHGHVDRLTFG